MSIGIAMNNAMHWDVSLWNTIMVLSMCQLWWLMVSFYIDICVEQCIQLLHICQCAIHSYFTFLHVPFDHLNGWNLHLLPCLVLFVTYRALAVSMDSLKFQSTWNSSGVPNAKLPIKVYESSIVISLFLFHVVDQKWWFNYGRNRHACRRQKNSITYSMLHYNHEIALFEFLSLFTYNYVDWWWWHFAICLIHFEKKCFCVACY